MLCVRISEYTTFFGREQIHIRNPVVWDNQTQPTIMAYFKQSVIIDVQVNILWHGSWKPGIVETEGTAVARE
jgi:hypothetical protein